MTALIRDIYNNLFEFVRTFGAFQLFFLRIVRHSPRIVMRRPGLVVKQIYNTGALSLVIIMVCGFFVGGVLASGVISSQQTTRFRPASLAAYIAWSARLTMSIVVNGSSGGIARPMLAVARSPF